MPQPMSFSRLWQCILQFALVLWVVRIAVTTTVLGLLILGLAPQAQDLFVEFADVPIWRMVLFVWLMVVVWAMPTHYAARLLLDTDERFRQLLAAQRESDQAHFLEVTARWVPRVLGLVTFVAVVIAIWRSHLNLPILDQTPEQTSVIDAVNGLSHRPHAAAQRDFAGHGEVAAHRNAGHHGDDRGSHGDAGRRVNP